MQIKLFVVIFVLASFSMGVQADSIQQLLNAAKSNNVVKISELLSAGTDVNVADGKGRTALMMAARRGSYDAAETLLKAGADVNQTHNRSATALFFAAKHDHTKLVQLLLAYGANKNIKNWKGKDAPAMAEKNNNLTMQQLLAENSHSIGIYAHFPQRDISDGQFASAAKRALTGRGWKISSQSNNLLTGVLEKSDFIYKCQIQKISNNEISIRYLPGFGVMKPNYLLNLEKDMRKNIEI